MRQPVPFGKYLLLDRISVGGMAEVFKAKSYGVEGFEKIIAIKRILPTMGEDRDFIKMFIDEAKIAGQLAHANICQIFELGRIDGSHFIAMEYIWGKDLLQLQNRFRKLKQPMPIAMACFAIAKVLEGLDYAHRKRDPLGRPLEIVHRDCSPQNVLVSYEGEVKVIDFGIAKATSRNSRTMAGVLKGKFGYMSPEQVRGLPLDRRSDIFAIGTMLFECLTSERLFQGETDFSTLEKVRNVDIPNPRTVNPAIPEAIERVILKALAKDVDNRYQWCSEMLVDLQQFLMTQDVVFTAKTLSSCLKEVFSPEIDKERGLLEQYKRVGRDGLIAGLPSAEAKLKVSEHLGEAEPPEADATQLGGPSFDDIESQLAAMASPEVGPASGSPAARGGTAPKPADDDDRDGDFGEEAPTEIFGEIEHGPLAGLASPTPSPATSRPSTQGPGSTPPKPPPGGRPQSQPRAGSVSTPPANGGFTVPQPSPANGGFAGFGARGEPQPYPAAVSPSALPTGTPGPQIQIGGGPPQPLNALAPPGQNNAAARTLIGATAPAGVPNYSGNYPRLSQAPNPQQGFGDAQPSQPYGSQPYPSQQPANPMQGYEQPQHPSGSNPQQGYPQQGQYPSNPNQQPYGQNPNPYGQHNNPYGQYPSNNPQSTGGYPQQTFPNPLGAGPSAANAVDGKTPRKSSLGRDIAIGVVIAVVVLGGFLAVKFLVLDSGDPEPAGGAAASKIATLKISLPGGTSAQLFVDDKPSGTFADKAEVPINVGLRKLKLVNGTEKCEREMTLDPAKPSVFDCTEIGLSGAGRAGTGSGSAATGSAATGSAGSGAAGSGATTGSGATAGSGAGSGMTAGSAGSGAGSAQVASLDPKKPTEKPVDPKKPVEVKNPDKPTEKPIEKPVDPKKPDPKKPDPKKPDPKKPDKMPEEAVAKTDKGYLEVYSTPKAKILVDGVDTGMSTPISGTRLALPPGKHKVTFVVGEDRFTFPTVIKAGATETLRKDLQ